MAQQQEVRLYNTAMFDSHLQKTVEELTKQRRNSKDTFERASLGDQINLVEKLQREYNANVKVQLGG